MRLNFTRRVRMWLADLMVYMYITQRFYNCLSNIYSKAVVLA